MSTENKHSKDFDGRWLRRATALENDFEDAHQQGHFLLCYTLRLESKDPMQGEHVERALSHLYRKCPSLHYCFGLRDGERWLRRPTNPKVDFEVLEGRDVDEVSKSLYSYRYNSETGPLFCARLLLNSADIIPDEEDLGSSPSHISYVLIGLHHSIGDGTTNVQIMGFFISLLNDVISNKPINDDETLGELIGDEYTEEVLEEYRKVLRDDPDLDAKIAHEIDLFEKNTSYIINCFPKGNVERQTSIVQHVLDRDSTGRFLQNCRNEGVTFNSGLSTVASVAVANLLLDEGIVCDSYKINSYSGVNIRRYWKTNLPKALGMHVGHQVLISTNVPQNIGTSYWDCARSVHENIWSSLKANKPLFFQSHKNLLSKDAPKSMFLEGTRQPCADFLITNMGNITPLVSEGGDGARITHIFRISSIHGFRKCLIHILCHTYRGRFTMTFAYDPSSIRKEVVQRFCDQIVKLMSTIV